MINKINKKKIIVAVSLVIVACLVFSGFYFYFYEDSPKEDKEPAEEPIVFIDTISPQGIHQAVSLEIKRIHKKGIEDLVSKIGNSWKKKPNFHCVGIIDDEKWVSHTIKDWDSGYIGWEVFRFVEDEKETSSVEINIAEPKKQLFKTVDEVIESFKVTYDFRTGRWSGDDSFNDSDGYGHYNGQDYEIWFDLQQIESDGDGIPYWTEINILGTDPMVDDSKLDPDNDSIPTSWEWRWGYDPFVWDNHSFLDIDVDGLDNTEEYYMEKWLANPFYKEIYIEVDFMEDSPKLFAPKHIMYKESQWMVMDKFSEHDITMHIDDGWPTGSNIGGGEYLRYVEDIIDVGDGVASEFYKYHFADERKGVFHYLFIQHGRIGWNLPVDSKWWPDLINIPANIKWFAKAMFPPAITPRLIRYSTSVAFMHELGHSLNLTPEYCLGIDNESQARRNDLPPIKQIQEMFRAIDYWDTYESIMNYNKFRYYLLDYSDGSHGEHDYDDWSKIDLTYFQKISSHTYGISDNFRN